MSSTYLKEGLALYGNVARSLCTSLVVLRSPSVLKIMAKSWQSPRPRWLSKFGYFMLQLACRDLMESSGIVIVNMAVLCACGSTPMFAEEVKARKGGRSCFLCGHMGTFSYWKMDVSFDSHWCPRLTEWHESIFYKYHIDADHDVKSVKQTVIGTYRNLMQSLLLDTQKIRWKC